LSPRIAASTSLPTSVALGPTDFNVRDTTHFGWRRQAAAKSRMILVPIPHDLVQAATVHAPHLVARLLDEMTEKRWAWCKRRVVDVAVQGLVHSKDELRHDARP